MDRYSAILNIIPYQKELAFVYNKNGYLSLINVKSGKVIRKLQL